MKKLDIYTSITIAANVVYILILVFLCQNNNIWYDESVSIGTVLWNDFGGIAQTLTNDAHPPLYFWGLRLFLNLFGESIPVMKLFSALGCILLSLLSFFPIWQLFGKKIAMYFSLMVLLFPPLYSIGLDIRMYSWGAFLVMVAFLSCYSLYKKPSLFRLLLTIFTSALVLYTHYYAFLCLCLLYLFIFLKLVKEHRPKEVVYIIIGEFICFIPWLCSFFQQFGNKGVVEKVAPFSLSKIAKTIIYFFYTGNDALRNEKIVYITSALLLVSTVCLFVFYFRKKEFNPIVILCITALIVFTIIGFALNFKVKFYARYLVNLIGIFYLSLSIMLEKLENYRKMLVCYFFVLLICFVCKLYYTYLREYDRELDKAVAYYNSYKSSSDIIIDGYGVGNILFEGIHEHTDQPKLWDKVFLHNSKIVHDISSTFKGEKIWVMIDSDAIDKSLRAKGYRLIFSREIRTNYYGHYFPMKLYQKMD